MIKGLGVDIASSMSGGALRSEKASSRNQLASSAASGKKDPDFAEQLLGAKSERLNGPDRNEQKKMSGRDVLNREDSRSTERETASKELRDPRADRSDKPKAKQLSRSKKGAENELSEDPATQRAPASRQPEQDYYAPIRSQRSQESETVEGASTDGILPSQGPLSQAKPTQPQGVDGVRLPDFFSKAALTGEKAVLPQGTNASAESAGMMAAMMQDQQLSREEAMEGFLLTMETELGVPPEKIMAAFAMMDDSALSAAPEASMQEFIANLELEPGQEARAEELYQDLLKTTGDSMLSQKLIGMEQGVNFEVMSPRDSRLRQLDKSLTQMNQSFFKKDGLMNEPKKAQAAVEAMDAELARLMQSTQATQLSAGDTESSDPDAILAGAGIGIGAGSILGDASVASSGTAIGADSGALAGLMSSNSGSGSGFGGSQGFESGSMAQDASALAFTDSLKATASNEASFASEMKESLSSQVTPETGIAGSDASVLPGNAQAASQAPIANSLSGAGAAAASRSEMMMNRQPTAEDEQANVRELIKQAQVVLKRGGGEMKLEMTPEGMGQVHLKVAVENGQVNVQMLTESESAKRLLEKGLGELKTSLAAQQLKVENVSVDVGQEIQKQMDHQANQEQAREQARQQAQAFMGQFRDERQGFRQGMFDQSGFKSYGRSQNRASVMPEEISQASTSSRKISGDGSRRLNLVA